MQDNRKKEFDILKGMGILWMIMNHSNMGMLFSHYVSAFHMQLFFLVSGYFFNSKKGKYLNRKIKTILLPYASFASITIFICIMVNVILKDNIFSYRNIVLGIIWSNQAIFPITGAIWFLQCLFIIEIIFYFLNKKIKGVKLTIAITGIALIGIILSLLNIKLPFSLDSSLSALPFFYLGFLLKNYENKMKKVYDHALLIGITLIVFSCVLIFVNEYVNPRTCEYGVVPLYFLNAVLASFGWLCVAKKVDELSSKVHILECLSNIVAYIGKNSIIFLGFNQLIIDGLYWMINRCFSFETMIQKGFRNIFICILSCVILYYFAYLFENTKLSFFVGKSEKRY